MVDALPETKLDTAQLLLEVMELLARSDDPRLADLSGRLAAGAEARVSDPADEGVVLDELRAIRNLLVHRIGVDPVLRALEDAPEDDEPVTPGDAAVLDRRRESAASGRTTADHEVARKLSR
jgi:hypothetical protein